MDVEYHVSCIYDKLTIYGGEGVTSDIIWQGCDEEARFPTGGIEFVTDFENVTFVWTSDALTHLSGFELIFWTVPPTGEPMTGDVTTGKYFVLLYSKLNHLSE